LQNIKEYGFPSDSTSYPDIRTLFINQLALADLRTYAFAGKLCKKRGSFTSIDSLQVMLFLLAR